MNLKLIRFYHEKGTNGALFSNGQLVCFTIELPWRGNKSNVSCIPEDIYPVVKRESEHHGNHLWIREVPGRDLILIHKANNAELQLEGCIAPVSIHSGYGRGDFSQLAFDFLYQLVSGAIDRKEPVTLEIISLAKQQAIITSLQPKIPCKPMATAA
jgi:hypothetical protein